MATPRPRVMQRVERVISFWPQIYTDETQMGGEEIYKESRKAGT